MEIPFLVPYLQWSFLGNNGSAYLDSLAIFIGLTILFIIVKTFVLMQLKRWARHSKTHYDDAIVAALLRLHWPFYAVVAFYIAAGFLVLPAVVDRILFFALLAVLLYYAVRQLSVFIDWYAGIEAAKHEEEGNSMIIVMANMAKAVLWLLAILLLLQNMGIEITALIAAVGVGGIAIAFALQNILEDVFSSFSIYFDKPFRKGDFIIVGSDMGVVKYIGLKTTRIQTLQGQELVISNRELTTTRVNNYKRMDSRRVQFGFGITYNTPLTKMRTANEIVSDVIGKLDGARLDRTHFKEFGDSALLFEVVYYAQTADYNAYMDLQQAINFGIKEGFERAGISMAFPTRTVHLINN